MKEEIAKIDVVNDGTILMCLYAMLVLPKELMWQEFPQERDFIEDFLQRNTVNTKTTYKEDSPKISFLRHVRNAVAHARISCHPEAICFFDEKQGRENQGRSEEFSTELPRSQLAPFVFDTLLKVHKSFLARAGGDPNPGTGGS